VLASLLNHASSATRSGVVGTDQRALLIAPMRKVAAQCDWLLHEAIGLPVMVREILSCQVLWRGASRVKRCAEEVLALSRR
jgi:hypothetical protein